MVCCWKFEHWVGVSVVKWGGVRLPCSCFRLWTSICKQKSRESGSTRSSMRVEWGRSAFVVRLVSPAALTATSLQQLTEEDHRPGGQQQHELCSSAKSVSNAFINYYHFLILVEREKTNLYFSSSIYTRYRSSIIIKHIHRNSSSYFWHPVTSICGTYHQFTI